MNIIKHTIQHTLSIFLILIGYSTLSLSSAQNLAYYSKQRDEQCKHVAQQLKRLWDENPDLDVDQYTDQKCCYTYLMAHAQSGDSELLKKALARTKRINAQDCNGFTVLNHAIISDSPECVQLTLAAGVRTDSHDLKSNLTPIQLAFSSGQFPIAMVLFRAGIPIPKGTALRYSIVGRPITSNETAMPTTHAQKAEIKSVSEQIVLAQHVSKRKARRQKLVATAAAIAHKASTSEGKASAEKEEFDTTGMLSSHELALFDDIPPSVMAKSPEKVKPRASQIWYIGSLKFTQKNKRLQRLFEPMVWVMPTPEK